MAYEFFVVMQKRSDAKVYADLHKTDERMYLVEEKADEALAGMGDLANHYNKVKIIGVLADEWNSAELARADLEATVKEQSQQLSDITAHAESIEKLSRERGRQLEEQAAEIERLSERRCEICGYAEHHREHTGCLRQQLAAAQLHIEQLRGAMLMMLCDSEGKCCMAGSDEDRFIIDTALSTKPDLSALEAERQRVAEACAKVCENDESGRDSGGYFADTIRAGQWREHLK